MLTNKTMKTPEEFATYWVCKPPKDCGLEAFRDFIISIQKDAFDCGKKRGFLESKHALQMLQMKFAKHASYRALDKGIKAIEMRELQPQTL